MLKVLVIGCIKNASKHDCELAKICIRKCRSYRATRISVLLEKVASILNGSCDFLSRQCIVFQFKFEVSLRVARYREI